MKRLLAFALACLLGCPSDLAIGVVINGELERAKLENLTTDPASAGEGRIFWDSDDNLFRFYTGAAWRTVADTTTALVNPMDSDGDMIYGGAAGAATKLDSGTSGMWLVSGGAAAPTWTNTTTTAKTIDGSADAVQWTVQGNGTQTNSIEVIEKSDGTDLRTIDNSGRMLLPLQPAFRVQKSAGTTLTCGTLISSGGTGTQISFGTESFDKAGNFASNQFTAPIAGYYQLQAQLRISRGTATDMQCGFFKNGSTLMQYMRKLSSSWTADQAVLIELASLAASDTVEVRCVCDSGTTSTVDETNQSVFSGFLAN